MKYEKEDLEQRLVGLERRMQEALLRREEGLQHNASLRHENEVSACMCHSVQRWVSGLSLKP